jgi:hypothetical protein
MQCAHGIEVLWSRLQGDHRASVAGFGNFKTNQVSYRRSVFHHALK